ncbi:MAG: AMP-dependent synthetase and ligase [Candidatus Solibacter sp.]|jgi:fatty-acyl-CoA synthase|nr:AMP-dependent synthetase and ligase [Candidatus Solibacter sp.]
MTAPLTPLDFLARSARTWRDRLAVVDGDRRFTYAEFAARVERQAAGLQALGVGPGDRVAVLAPNCAMALEAHFSPMRIGAVLVMLNTRLAAAELAWILAHCGAKAVLVDPALRHLIAGSVVEHVIDDYEAFLAAAPAHCAPVPVTDENACIAINYTSGTTGFPKGVMFSHRGAWVNAIGEIIEYGLTQRSVYLWTLPMFHCNGWCFAWAVTAAGGLHICLRQPDAREAVALIQQQSVTHLCGAPVVVSSLAQFCAANQVKFAHALRIVTAGAPPPPAVIRAAEATGAELCHAYGLTETYGPHTICAWNPAWDDLPAPERALLRARQGVAYLVAGTDLRVVDVSMNDVPADGQTMGEVLMRGNNVMLGYYASPKATEEVFQGGWFHSGDLAVVHADGYIELRDRMKDIVISGGENISSIEVEKTLADHPAVAEVAIVAVPDEKWGEVPKAYVGLKPGCEATAEELIEWCRTRMAHFKAPKHVEFGPLPRTATGKIRKNELRSKARANV